MGSIRFGGVSEGILGGGNSFFEQDTTKYTGVRDISLSWQPRLGIGFCRVEGLVGFLPFGGVSEATLGGGICFLMSSRDMDTMLDTGNRVQFSCGICYLRLEETKCEAVAGISW